MKSVLISIQPKYCELIVNGKKKCEYCKKPLFYDLWKEIGKIKVVNRPPQSWQYVEEI